MNVSRIQTLNTPLLKLNITYIFRICSYVSKNLSKLEQSYLYIFATDPEKLYEKAYFSPLMEFNRNDRVCLLKQEHFNPSQILSPKRLRIASFRVQKTVNMSDFSKKESIYFISSTVKKSRYEKTSFSTDSTFWTSTPISQSETATTTTCPEWLMFILILPPFKNKKGFPYLLFFIIILLVEMLYISFSTQPNIPWAILWCISKRLLELKIFESLKPLRQPISKKNISFLRHSCSSRSIFSYF